MDTTVQAEVREVADYARVMEYVKTLVEHGMQDQRRIQVLEERSRLMEEEILRLRESKESSKEPQKVHNSRKDEMMKPWLVSKVELDDEIALKVNSEFKKSLEDGAKGLGVSTGALIRQLLARLLPDLEPNVGPTKFKKDTGIEVKLVKPKARTAVKEKKVKPKEKKIKAKK